MVHRARDRAHGAWVAVKISQGPGSPDEIPRILREVELLRGLEAPHLARLLDLREAAGGGLALVYEFVDGSDLDALRARSTPTPATAVRWITEVATALDALHTRGVLHRDVKPGNVRIDSTGRAVLLDFGLARSLGQGGTLTATGWILGTPAFMAPEALRGEPPATSFDCFGLAALAYWCLSGRVPFPGEGPGEILARQAAPPAPLGDSLPPRLDGVLARALDRDPRNRFPDATSLAEALGEALEQGQGPEQGEAREARSPLLETIRLPGPGEPPPAPVPDATAPANQLLRAPLPEPAPAEGTRTRGPASPPSGGPRSEPVRSFSGRKPGLAIGLASLALLPCLAFLVSSFLPLPHRHRDPPTPPGPRASEGAQVSELARKLREELGSLEGRFFSPDGQEVAQGTPGAVYLLDGDPSRWPRILEDLPSLRALFEWHAGSGSLEDLPESALEELERSARFFLDQELPSPFGPLLRLAPTTTPIPLPDSVRAMLRAHPIAGPWPDRVEGWLATATGEVDRLLAGFTRKRVILDRAGEDLPEATRIWLRSRQLTKGRRSSLRRILKEGFYFHPLRPWLGQWIRPEVDAFQGSLHALGRSLSLEPGTRDLAADLLETLLEKDGVRYLLLSHLGAYPREWLLPSAFPGSWVPPLDAIRGDLRRGPEHPELASAKLRQAALAYLGSRLDAAEDPWVRRRLEASMLRLRTSLEEDPSED